MSSKKDRNRPINNIIKDQYLIEQLFSSLGLDVRPDGVLIDQDYLTPVYSYNKIVLYKPHDLSCDTTSEVLFNPSDDRQVKMIFDFYLKKLNDLEEMEALMYFDYTDPVTKELKSCVIFQSGAKAESDSYNNRSLRLIDLIFKIAGYADMQQYLRKYDDVVSLDGNKL